MKKKLVSLLLATSVVAATLAGCGAKETGTSVPAKTEETEVTKEAIPEAAYYFSFDEAAGTEGIQPTAQDTAAGALMAADKDVVFMPGVKGDAVYTDGQTGYKLTNVNGVGDTYTVSFWIYATRYANYMPTVQFGPDVHGDATGSQHYVNITRAEWNADGASFPCVWAYDQADNAKWPNYSTSGGNEHLKEWMHIALVVDPSKKSVDGEYIVGELYINGERHIEKDSDGNEINPLIVFNTMQASDNFDFLLGVNYWDKVFKGAFDELYIFDKALTAGQIASLYADGDANAKYVEPERIIDPQKDEKAIESIGNLQFTSNYDSASTPVAIKDGKTTQIKMKHWSDGKDAANNYRLVFKAGDKEVAVVNADMTGYLDGNASKAIPESNFSWTWANWNTWEQSVMVEAAVTLTISLDGNVVTVEANNIDYVETANVGTVSFEVSDTTDLTVEITNQKSYTDILSVKDTTPKTGGNIVGSTDCVVPFWTQFAPIWEVPVNGSKTISFTNYTDGVNNWDNFVAILQSTPEGHSADTEGYTEYGVVRADNFGWGAGYEVATAECDWNWDTFKDDMNGAHVVLTAYNYGDTADIVFTATTTAGTVYHQTYKGIAVTGPVYLTLTLENSYLVFDGVTVGSNDCVQGFWTTFSDIYEVKAGETKELSFTNYTDGINNWDNFVVILQNTPAGHSADAYEGYAEYAVFRADNFGWGEGYEATTAECDWNWETFKEDMDGAKVVLRVTNNGTTADTEIIATTVEGKVYHQSYKGTPISGDLYMTMTLENAYLVIDTVSFGSAENVQPFWTAFAPVYAVPAGETTSLSFTNFTDGVNNWDNFVVILQTTPEGHSADTPGYAEYAVFRADNFGWGEGYEATTAECNWNWDTFTEDMNGAHVVLNVTNNGTTADTVAYVTTQTGTVYTQSYKGTPISGDLYVTMTLENGSCAIN